MLSRLSVIVATAVAMPAFASPAFAHHQVPTKQTVLDLLFTSGFGPGAAMLRRCPHCSWARCCWFSVVGPRTSRRRVRAWKRRGSKNRSRRRQKSNLARKRPWAGSVRPAIGAYRG